MARSLRREFAEKGSRILLSYLKASVPIDTGALQDAITVILLEETAVLTVKDVVLQYDDHTVEAKLLALFLEVPYVQRRPPGGDNKKTIHFKRSQSNVMPNARKGMPTSSWFQEAIRQGLKEVEPLGQELTKAAIKKCVKDLLNGT